MRRVEASPERPELQPQLSSRLKLGSFKVVEVEARAPSTRRGPQQNDFSAFKPSPHPPARERALSSASTPSLRLESVQASTGAQRVQDSPSPLACAWTRSSARASPGGEPPLTTVNVRSQEAAAVLAVCLSQMIAVVEMDLHLQEHLRGQECPSCECTDPRSCRSACGLFVAAIANNRRRKNRSAPGGKPWRTGLLDAK